MNRFCRRYMNRRNLRPNFCWRLGRYRPATGNAGSGWAGDQAAGAIGMGIVSEGAVSATIALRE